MFIQQTPDGFVVVEKRLEDGTKVFLRASPSNGKLKLGNSYIQVSCDLFSLKGLMSDSHLRRPPVWERKVTSM